MYETIFVILTSVVVLVGLWEFHRAFVASVAETAFDKGFAAGVFVDTHRLLGTEPELLAVSIQSMKMDAVSEATRLPMRLWT